MQRPFETRAAVPPRAAGWPPRARRRNRVLAGVAVLAFVDGLLVALRLPEIAVLVTAGAAGAVGLAAAGVLLWHAGRQVWGRRSVVTKAGAASWSAVRGGAARGRSASRTVAAGSRSAARAAAAGSRTAVRAAAVELSRPREPWRPPRAVTAARLRFGAATGRAIPLRIAAYTAFAKLAAGAVDRASALGARAAANAGAAISRLRNLNDPPDATAPGPRQTRE